MAAYVISVIFPSKGYSNHWLPYNSFSWKYSWVVSYQIQCGVCDLKIYSLRLIQGPITITTSTSKSVLGLGLSDRWKTTSQIQGGNRAILRKHNLL